MSGHDMQHTSLCQCPVAHRAETGEAQRASLLGFDAAAGEKNFGRADSMPLLEEFRNQSGGSGTPYDMVAGPDDRPEIEVVKTNFVHQGIRAEIMFRDAQKADTG